VSIRPRPYLASNGLHGCVPSRTHDHYALHSWLRQCFPCWFLPPRRSMQQRLYLSLLLTCLSNRQCRSILFTEHFLGHAVLCPTLCLSGGSGVQGRIHIHTTRTKPLECRSWIASHISRNGSLRVYNYHPTRHFKTGTMF
jgi:hypothetical protein